MRKNFLLIGVMLAIVLLLVGCGTGTSESDSKKSEPEIGSSVQGQDTQAGNADAETAAGNSEKQEDNSSVSSFDGTLIVYFSCTGNTKGIAEKIAEVTGGDLFEIVPAQPYTDDDLNYNDRNSRSTKEQDDPSARPEIGNSVENWDSYGTVYIGYPIWWAEEPRIMDTFAESYDFTGKTVIPFCTSGGSGVGRSDDNIIANAKGSGNWLEGTKLRSSSTEKDIADWIAGLSNN